MAIQALISANLTARRFPFVAIATVVAAACSLGFALKSLYYALTTPHSLPLHDQWFFVFDYLRYHDGQYRWIELFNWHNEHRIFTTRLVLFADAMLFSMAGLLPVMTTYFALAAIATVLIRLATKGTASVAGQVVGVLISLGTAWGLSQQANLMTGFQVQHPFVLLFALCALGALAASMMADDGRRRALWLTAALLADFLTVFSLGSGVLLAIPVLALAIWIRKGGVPLLTFLAFHAVLTALYLSNNRFFGPGGHRVNDDLRSILDLILRFLVHGIFDGRSFEALAGLALLALFAAFALTATFRSIILRKPFERNAAILVAFQFFIVLEAAAVAYERAGRGLSPIYATHSIMFIVALLCLIWRLTDSEWSRIAVLGTAVGVTLLANSPWYRTYLRTDFQAMQNDATAMILAGGKDYGRFPLVFTHNSYDLIDNAIGRMRELRLGPFR